VSPRVFPPALGLAPDHRKQDDPIDDIGYRRFAPAEAGLLAEFLTTEDWPYHGAGAPSAAPIRQQAAAGDYDNDRTRAFWIVTSADAQAGLIRLLDLGDDTPLRALPGWITFSLARSARRAEPDEPAVMATSASATLTIHCN
jgi:hypothetical protein